ncbi:phytanoyl-CoA dioxygenase, peroxisomal-like isoform X2 [Anneissia japonica]|uniref:phytanoyl-CoA dioxygenase, peroxisomal-like isoform X2 n=1 Tax=Anneissia japonica TaxID=1529436 RepID=UPI001425B906|nr:phytanoyl-CoA dioxygenase, peroxisomal-like isoform X2 [Anneissia japonica]
MEEKTASVKDWSTVSVPSGGLFKPVEDARSWSNFDLPAERVKEFWENGYITNVPVLTPDQCDNILTVYQELVEKSNEFPGYELLYEHHSNQSGDPDNVLMHCLGHWRFNQLFHDLVFLPEIAVPSSKLLHPAEDKSVRLWHDQLFAKPPRHGGVVAWHQDYSYWTRTKPMMHLTVHIALDEQTLDNGALHYVPGSHKWRKNGEPLPITDLNFKDMESIQTVLTEEEKALFKPVPSLLKKGEASFHHPLMVHGSYGNRSECPRRACVVNYIADGVVSDSEDPLLQKTNPVPKGEKLNGQFYPLIYDPSWKQAN